MSDNEVCKTALVDICKEFLVYLRDMKRRGLISEAEYKSHSRMKIMFLDQMRE